MLTKMFSNLVSSAFNGKYWTQINSVTIIEQRVVYFVVVSSTWYKYKPSDDRKDDGQSVSDDHGKI